MKPQNGSLGDHKGRLCRQPWLAATRWRQTPSQAGRLLLAVISSPARSPLRPASSADAAQAWGGAAEVAGEARGRARGAESPGEVPQALTFSLSLVLSRKLTSPRKAAQKRRHHTLPGFDSTAHSTSLQGIMDHEMHGSNAGCPRGLEKARPCLRAACRTAQPWARCSQGWA